MTAPAGCAWTTTPSAAWLTIAAGSSGSGDGTATVVAAPNDTSLSRVGTVTIAGQVVTFTQAGTTCTFLVAPTDVTAAAGGSSDVLSVTAPAGCAWTATSTASWLTITSGASGFGNGTVGVASAPNATGASRLGTLVVAGHTVTVTQTACSFAVDPDTIDMSAPGGSTSVAVTAPVGCGWTATSNASWLTITSGANGFGNGTAGISVASNTGSSRSGTLTVAGQTVTVNQAAP